MPYTFQIYPNEWIVLPQPGDLFEVTEISEAIDFHWGKCLVVQLVLVEKRLERALSYSTQEGESPYDTT